MVKARRSLGSLLVFYLLPMMLLVAVVEGFGLVKWGEPQAGIFHRIHKFTVGEVVIFEAAHSLLTLLALWFAPVLIKMLGEPFTGGTLTRRRSRWSFMD